MLLLLGLATYGGYYLYNNYQTSDIKKQVDDLTGKNDWSFLVVGDNEGINEPIKKFISDANQSDAKLVVTVGDLTKNGTPDEFVAANNLFSQLTMLYYPTLGNNDLGSVLDYQYDNYQQTVTDKLYYSFNYQQAHFVILDNANRYIGFSAEELAWLAEDLKQNSQKYTFLFFHRPIKQPFEKFTGDDETKKSRASNDQFLEIIKNYKIDHVFVGHAHTYFNYQLADIPVTITGGGGAQPQDILGGESAALYHYLKVTVSNDEATVEMITL